MRQFSNYFRFSHKMPLRCVSLPEYLALPDGPSDYAGMMIEFQKEDERARSNGEPIQGYTEQESVWPAERISEDPEGFREHVSILEHGEPFSIRRLLFVDDDDRLLGETFLRELKTEKGVACSPLTYIRPSARGLGYGSSVMYLMLDEAAKTARDVEVSIREDNPASWRRFEKLGCSRSADVVSEDGSVWRVYQPIRDGIVTWLKNPSFDLDSRRETKTRASNRPKTV